MKTRFYIYQSGELKRQDESLVLITSSEKIYIPIMQIELINVFSQVTFNKVALSLLNQYGIIMNLFNYYGVYQGSFIPDYPKHGKNIIAHVEHVKDEIKRFNIAKEIIYASSLNMLAVLKYYHKKRAICSEEIHKMGSIIKELENTTCLNINSLMLIEARIKQLYYSCFDKIILNPVFRFESRSVQPPKNEINAMMSFGYSILYSIIESIIHRSSLVISLPFIHSLDRRKEGLQYDIADIFKPVIIDRTIFRMINRNQITKLHFEEYKNGIYLSKYGSKIFIEEVESFLKSTINLDQFNRKYSYNQLLSKEIHKLTNHIIEKKKYQGFKMRW